MSQSKITESDFIKGFDCLIHDLKHPLSLLPHYLSELAARHEIPNDDSSLQRLQSLIRSAQGLADNALLMDKILLGALRVKKSPDNFNQIVAEASSHFAPVCKQAGITLVIETDNTMPEVPVDPACFPRVVHNLVSNSVKYTPTAGSIRIATTSDKNFAILEVQDSGSGISEDAFESVFKPYCRLDPREYEGSGLGLFIVKSLVDAHGGTVELESNKASGTLFRIKIPLGGA